LIDKLTSGQASRCVFKSRIKRSDSTVGSRHESGSEFYNAGPATEKARPPNVVRRNRVIFSLRRLTERRCWRPETSETVTQQSARYLGTRHRRHQWTNAKE